MPSAHARPSDVKAADGVVLVDGPDGVVVTFTAEAAEQTAERLKEAARDARGSCEDDR